MPEQPTVSLPPKKTKESYPAYSTSTKLQKAYYLAKTAFLMLLSSFLVALSSYSFIAPNKFATGGVSGIAVLLEYAFDIPQSFTMFFVNFPLLVLAFFFVKRKFALISLASVLLQTLWLFAMEKCGMPRLVFDEQIFAALAGGIGIGAAVAIAFKCGGSTGGMDIIAVMVQKKIHATSVAWMIFILNCVLIAVSFFVYRTDGSDLSLQVLPVIKAATELFVESRVNDAITSGFHSAVEFRVITDKPDEMGVALISRLGRGVTLLKAKGMYTNETHNMLLCVLSRRQVPLFKQIIKEIDPDSFAVMSKVSQVMGLGFYSSES